MTWTLQSIQTLLLDRPGPSLHNTAAATSLTSFINVSRQPKSRKPEQNYFLGKWFMYRENRIFGPIFRVSLRWKAPGGSPRLQSGVSVAKGGERSENGVSAAKGRTVLRTVKRFLSSRLRPAHSAAERASKRETHTLYA
jgi:hypothetical protein